MPVYITSESDPQGAEIVRYGFYDNNQEAREVCNFTNSVLNKPS